MARPSDVVRIASALPGALRGGSEERLAFELEVKVRVPQLRVLIESAWRCVAPPARRSR